MVFCSVLFSCCLLLFSSLPIPVPILPFTLIRSPLFVCLFVPCILRLYPILISKEREREQTARPQTPSPKPSTNLINRLNNSPIPLPTSLHSLAINTRSTCSRKASFACFFPSLVVYVLYIEGVDVAGNVAKNRKTDINQQISTTSRDGPDSDGGK